MDHKKMKKLGIVITDGVGFRNFILSDFIIEAKKTFDEVVIFSCLPLEAFMELNLDCTIVELDVFKENFLTWFFRKAKEVSHLSLHAQGNFGINDNFNASKTKARNPRGIATQFIHKWIKKNNSEKRIQSYNRLQQMTFQSHKLTKQYEEILKKYGVSILFFTHQRPPFIAPLIYASEKLRIKNAAFIFSWDNLASKGRMAGNFDYYLVWSDLMQKELLHFYQSVKKNQIEIVGTPQFEPYVLERYESSKEEFISKFNLDINNKTIFYSCGDISTSKNDELYISIIANSILDGSIKNINFIVRTSPAEDPIRFKEIVEKYPFIVWNFPKWILSRKGHQEEWSQRIPNIEDIKDLRAILEFSDININVVSTMTIDFMLFDKPVIFPVFGNGDNGLYNDQRFLKFAHLENVEKSNAVYITYNEMELLEAINCSLFDPTKKIKFQKELLQLEIGKPLLGTSQRVADYLYKIAK
jgi:CDP-glycerol glycerophosphotransferase (TagB/SpsB family)